ncbi:hypothetical protein IOC51_06545 [Vibrio parahaemolyticus]|uniref:hypothetical protein n=1 Tax=Vibrio parahaemolyticus TaxID=670 RepID=UPI001E407D37|nr:hypothetical protein [Vibrio parahaemolyticus]MCD1413694.1 hypothetical protein [Vibrio parahaemolyticus]
MAKKFFIATCEKKVSKHPIKDGKVFTIPVEAETQADAKEFAKAQVEKLDVTFEGKSETYSDWFKNPNLEKVSEEEFNAVVLEHEAKQPCNEELTDGGELQQRLPSVPYPTLGQDGFYDTKDPLVEESSFIYSSETDNMQAAKVFVLCVGHSQYAYGFRYKFGDFDKHERMNLDRIEEKRDDAVDKAIGRLENFLDYQDEFGSEEHKPFISALMKHDFYRAFLEPSELFLEALSKHPDVQNALEQHGDFYEVVESHFADVWPLDKSPEQAIEHVNAMVTISVLYDLEAFTESFKPYIPAKLTEKTKESMKHIEEVIDKSAANDASINPKCWKAALPVTDELHVVIAIKDCDDEGWQSAFEGNLKTERVFGDANDFSGEFATTRKEAIKMSAQSITDALYKYDSSLSLAKIFMKSPYIQDFEENCIEVTVGEDVEQNKCSPIETAIRNRLARRPTANMTAAEVKLALDSITPHVTEQTNIDELVNSIGCLEQCGSLFHEDDAALLVAGCTVKMEKKPKESTHNLDNEHECFIAEILSRLQTDGANFLTGAQFNEAGEKLREALDEANQAYSEDGKAFDRAGTLENIRNVDWDNINEVSKVFLNIRSLRACIRENVEQIDNAENASNEVEKKEAHPHIREHLSHLLRMNRVEDDLTEEEIELYLNNLKLAYEHVGEFYKYQTPFASAVVKCYTVLGGTPKEYVGIITKHLSNLEELKKYFELIKQVESEFDPAYCLHHLITENSQETSSGNNEPEPPQNLPKQGKNKPKVTSDGQKVTKQEPLPQPANDELIADSDSNTNGSNVPQNIVEQEPANDPEIPDIDLDESNSNMSIWNRAFKTDLAFTKRDTSTGFLSINPQYRGMKATEIFGSEGKGWGVDVKRYWIEDGMPVLVNGQPIGICESVQHMEIELWYIHPDDGQRYSIPSFGETERFYWSRNYSCLIKNTDCYKKSLTDAKGKALAMLGICGDVYMGEYDDAHIETLNHNVVEAAKKARHLEEEERIRKSVTEMLESIKHELETVSSKAEAEALESKGAAKIIALPDISQKQKAIKESYTKALRRYYEKAIDRLTPKQEAK